MGRIWSIMMTGKLTSPGVIRSVMTTVQLLHVLGKFFCIYIQIFFSKIFINVSMD